MTTARRGVAIKSVNSANAWPATGCAAVAKKSSIGTTARLREVRLTLSPDAGNCCVGRPLDAVDQAKQELIERGANSWLKLLKTRNIPWRFDVIEVIVEEGRLPRVNRVENVF